MVEYIVGKINYINSSYLVLENNFLGYKVNVSDTSKFEVNKVQKVYIYTKIFQNVKNTFNFEYYGFKTLSEKIFFETLLNVNGVGTKTSLLILKNDLNIIKNLIKNQDIDSLSNLEGFTKKIATNIVGQLSYKLKYEKNNELLKNDESISQKLPELISALKSLGYKKNEIDSVICNINDDVIEKCSEISDLISFAIKNIIENKDATK